MTEIVTVSFDEYLKQTDKAGLFTIDGEEVWIPLNEISIHLSEQEIELPLWLAEEKGLA